MPETSRPARLTSTRTNRLLSHPQKNTEACDELRRWVQMHLSPLLVERMAESAECSIHACYHMIEGSQKLSADLIVALLEHVPTDETEAALNKCLAHTSFRIVRLPAARTASTSLLIAAADASQGAGSVVSAAAHALDDGRVDAREAADLDGRATAVAAQLVQFADQARRMAS